MEKPHDNATLIGSTPDDQQYHLLRIESRRRGVGLAELARQAVDRTYGETNRHDQHAALEASFGAWESGEDGVTYVDQLRRGMYVGRLLDGPPCATVALPVVAAYHPCCPPCR